MLGVALHLAGDAFNNLLVMFSAVVFLKTHFIYADPIASLIVGLMILLSAYPLVKQSGRILLESAPREIDIQGVEKDVNRVEGIVGVHDIHIWSLTQSKALATLHVAVEDDSVSGFMRVFYYAVLAPLGYTLAHNPARTRPF
jgi:zinc transporter 1